MGNRCAGSVMAVLAVAAAGSAEVELTWGSLPDLPVAVSGHFAGWSNGAIIVEGGAHFPTPLFEGGEKVWIDTTLVLKPGWSKWWTIATSRPSAYGATVTTDRGIVLIGGGNADEHSDDVGTLAWLDPGLRIGALPDLPEPCAFTSASMLMRQ